MTSKEAFEQIAAVDLSTVANIATALTVLTAVVFGLNHHSRGLIEVVVRALFRTFHALFKSRASK